MKKFLPSFLIALVLLTIGSNFVLADGTNVNLTVKNNGDVVYSGSIALPPAGTISINDSSGDPHDTNADSVLSIINTADTLSTAFNISNLIYYNSFGAFYLKCINVSGSDLCDDWQYKINDVSPSNGMDSEILAGGENVVLYFGDENKAPEPEPVHNSGGGGGFMALSLNAASPISPVSNPPASTTPAPTPPVPVSTPPVSAPIPAPAPLNTTLEEKSKEELKGQSFKNPQRTVLGKTKKTNKILKQNTATALNAVPNTPPVPQTETPQQVKKGWFKNLLDSIFSIF